MRVLSLTTSCSWANVGVLHDGEWLAAEAFHHATDILQGLTLRVAKMLDDCHTELADIDRIVLDVGPGSFTGVRVGVMTAKALAWAAGIPVVGVTSLESIAVCVPFRAADAVVSLVKARPACVYFQCFHQAEGHWSPLNDPEMLPIADLGARVKSMRFGGPCRVVAADLSEEDRLQVRAVLDAAGVALKGISAILPTFNRVYRRAERLLLQGIAQDPLALSPLYVAPPNIGQPRPVR